MPRPKDPNAKTGTQRNRALAARKAERARQIEAALDAVLAATKLADAKRAVLAVRGS